MKKIVVMRRGGLGDFITGTVPLCNYLEEKYGECEFHFFMNSSNIGIAKYFFPKAKAHLIPKNNRLYNHIKYGLQYRYIKPDIGINTPPDFPRYNSMFLYAIGAKERYGRLGGSMVAKMLLNKPSNLYRYVDLSEDHDGLCALKIFDNSITKIEKRWYPKFQIQLLREFLPKNKGPYIMVELSNNRPWCLLRTEKTAAILNEFAQKHSFSVLITALKKDAYKAESLQKHLDIPNELFVSESLDSFLDFVNAADLVLCGDGGLAHIAASMNKKLVALFGRTPVYHWGPLGERLIILYHPDDVNEIDNDDILQSMEELW